LIDFNWHPGVQAEAALYVFTARARRIDCDNKFARASIATGAFAREWARIPLSGAF
jgi:hypothetical protein